MSGGQPLARGDRVELTAVTDDYARFALKAGDTGTVELVDSLGTIHIRWDSGAHIGITAGLAHLVRQTPPGAAYGSPPGPGNANPADRKEGRP